jgi:hypothetical protein
VIVIGFEVDAVSVTGNLAFNGAALTACTIIANVFAIAFGLAIATVFFGLLEVEASVIADGFIFTTFRFAFAIFTGLTGFCVACVCTASAVSVIVFEINALIAAFFLSLRTSCNASSIVTDLVIAAFVFFSASAAVFGICVCIDAFITAQGESAINLACSGFANFCGRALFIIVAFGVASAAMIGIGLEVIASIAAFLLAVFAVPFA